MAVHQLSTWMPLATVPGTYLSRAITMREFWLACEAESVSNHAYGQLEIGSRATPQEFRQVRRSYALQTCGGPNCDSS